jgi:hypothetical protein
MAPLFKRFSVLISFLFFFLLASVLSFRGSKVGFQYVFNQTGNHLSRTSSWCQGDQCTTGSWKPRQPPFQTLKELKDSYMNHDSDWFWTCEPAPGLPTRTEREKSEAGVKRQLDAANWVWEPDVGKMKSWDAEEFVIRMLRSPGGMIFIGGENLDITPISSPLAL